MTDFVGLARYMYLRRLMVVLLNCICLQLLVVRTIIAKENKKWTNVENQAFENHYMINLKCILKFLFFKFEVAGDRRLSIANIWYICW